MKRKLSYAGTLLVVCLMIASCSRGNDTGNQVPQSNSTNESNGVTKDEMNEVTTRIDNLSEQIAEMDTYVRDTVDKYTNAGASDTGSTTGNDNNTQSAGNATQQLPDDFSEYLKQAQDLKDVITKNKETDLTFYHTQRKAINELERLIDAFDEQIETSFEKGELSKEVYTEKERQLDEIENLLDESENTLKRQFKLDD